MHRIHTPAFSYRPFTRRRPLWLGNGGGTLYKKEEHGDTRNKTYLPATTATTKRYYHATPKHEILPLIVAGLVLGTGGYYSYRALQRMKVEWEDYQWELQRYEAQQLKENAIRLQTIGIDLGSVYTKLAVTHPTRQVVANREGDRAFFNGIVYDKQEHGEEQEIVLCTGRSALEKFSYHGEAVTMPYTNITRRKVITDALQPVVDEVLDRFQPDQPVRKVVTIPTGLLYMDGGMEFQAAFGNIVKNSAKAFVPEPVATIWGATFDQLIPDDPQKYIMVVDVGGFVTQISIVNNHKVLYSTSLPLGGEIFIEEIVKLLQTPELEQDERSMALLQVHARSALAELSTHIRTQVHVPYISMNTHLDESVARPILEQTIENHVRTHLHDLPNLSASLPAPNDLSSLFVSVITHVLERSELLPFNLAKILLVGGGAKTPHVQKSLSNALHTFMGPESNDKYLYLDKEMTVLGATTLLPSFDYDLDDGLVRE